jgi:hypothetical protein
MAFRPSAVSGRSLGGPMRGFDLEEEEVARLRGEGVAERGSLEEITKEQRVVFVLHREDLTGTLEAFAGEKDRLVNVVPGKGDYGGGRGIEGIRGSWLVFEGPE